MSETANKNQNQEPENTERELTWEEYDSIKDVLTYVGSVADFENCLFRPGQHSYLAGRKSCRERWNEVSSRRKERRTMGRGLQKTLQSLTDDGSVPETAQNVGLS